MVTMETRIPGFSFFKKSIPALLALALILAACTSPSSTPTPTLVSGVAACDASKVTVTDVHWFTDAQGAWHVVGVINNATDVTIAKVVTGAETYNKNGQHADQGEDVSAYPLNLPPGGQAPYVAYINRTIPGLDHFEVEVDECVAAEPEQNGQVDIRAGQITVDDSGEADLSAILFNSGTSPVLVNGSMGAVYDTSGGLVSAGYVDIATRHLEPGESGPVRVRLALPPGTTLGDLDGWKLFMDVLVDQPASLPLDVSKGVQIISTYSDSAGHFHLVGTLTNPGSSAVMTSLQASVYSDSTRDSLVDAAQYSTWLPLQPGESLPFDITGWGALDNSAGLWSSLESKQPAIDLRLEPFLTWSTQVKTVKLSLQGDQVTYSGSQAVFTGSVLNDSGSSIINGLVTAQLTAHQGGQLVATGNFQLEITGSAPVGQTFNYSITVPLPPQVDPATLDASASAEGQLP